MTTIRPVPLRPAPPADVIAVARQPQRGPAVAPADSDIPSQLPLRPPEGRSVDDATHTVVQRAASALVSAGAARLDSSGSLQFTRGTRSPTVPVQRDNTPAAAPEPPAGEAAGGDGAGEPPAAAAAPAGAAPAAGDQAGGGGGGGGAGGGGGGGDAQARELYPHIRALLAAELRRDRELAGHLSDRWR
jgi:hypothetical protein